MRSRWRSVSPSPLSSQLWTDWAFSHAFVVQFNGVVGKALDSRDRVTDLETQVAELGRELEEKEEELVQLGKLVASDRVKAASSVASTPDLVQAKMEQVDAQIGSGPTVNGNADEVIRALRADVSHFS